MEILTSLDLLRTSFPYNTSNYENNFINLKVLKAIHDFCNNNPYIEKVYGNSVPGSDIDHVRIQVNTPLSIAEKKAIAYKLEDEIYPELHVIRAKDKKSYIRKVLNRG